MMVSNVQNSAQPPPLSYADRVKKSQRNAAPSAGSAPRPSAQAQAPSAAIAAPSAPKVVKPSAIDSSAKQQGAPSAAADRPAPSSPDTPRKAVEPKQANGEASRASAADPVAGPSTVSAKKASAPPAVNVWSLRQEKARMLSQQSPRGPDFPSPAAIPTGNNPISIPSASAQASASTDSGRKDVEVGNSTSVTAAAAAAAAAGLVHEEDPWTVRPHLAPTAVPLPHLDATSWPEVGKGTSPNASLSQEVATGGNAERDERVKKETSGSGSRRGEKPKWVAIPAEELRAAADAQRSAQSSSASASHSRSQSQQRPQNRTQGSYSGSAARSGHASQERGKAPVKDRASAPHSEAHSRTGSIQSSPRHASMRLRRLPDDGTGPSSKRSSRTNSPRPYTAGPAATAAPVSEGPHGSISPPMVVNGSTYYPPVPPPHMPHPYSIPTPPYPPPPGAMPRMYNPAYAPYPPYPYPPVPGQPYMYWGGAAVPPDPRHAYAMSSQSQSPATHPSSLARSDPSPPTSVGLSPRDEQTESAVVPPIAGAKEGPASAQAPLTERKSSRGRQRLLSFGSIRADGEIVDDGEGTDGSQDMQISPKEPATLGLDITSLKINDDAEGTPRHAESLPASNAERAIPAFSVGLAPGDPGPSKTKAPPVIPAVNGAYIPPTASHVAINGSEPVLGASASSEPTWQFGTARQDAAGAELPAASSQIEATPEPGKTTDAPASRPELHPEGIPLRVRLSPLGMNAEGLPPTPVPPSAPGALYANDVPLPVPEGATPSADEWRVRDFGYGFGRPQPDGSYAPRDERNAKDRPYYGGRSAPRSFESGSEGYRRGFGGRRGRGSARGYGRGSRRGEYAPRGYGRYPRDVEVEGEEGIVYGVPPMDPGVYYGPHMPPAGFVPPAYDMYGPYTGYPLPPVVPATQPAAPVPTPVTKLSFPLDPTRYYLLGQLEYYLSEDNMAQDFYLRKHMDSRGWISTLLLASFPRVKTLTYDLQLVKDVLILSSLVEVKGDWVRPYKWARYLLPDAAPSIVDSGTTPPPEPAVTTQVDLEQLLLQNPPPRPSEENGAAAVPPYGDPQLAASQVSAVAQLEEVHVHIETANHVQEYVSEELQEYEDDEEEEEEEDDVVFVLGKDANRSWTPERKTEA